MSARNGRYRVFLCDDVADIRMLLRFALEDEPDLEVVGEADDGLTCVERIAQADPDVVVVDLSMPGLDGLEVISRVREANPDAGIVVFSGFAADRMDPLARSLGADRYLEKGAALDQVCRTVREVARERPYSPGESS